MKKNPNREFFLKRWFKRAFLGSGRELDLMEEERIATPLKTMARSFLHNKSAMSGVIVFALILLFVLIGPRFQVLDLSEQDSTLTNLPPGFYMMAYPDEIKQSRRDIAPGNTYALGIDGEGGLHIWGHTRITDTIDLRNVPEEVMNTDILMLAAGEDHVVALDENKQLYVWGNTRLRQGRFTNEMKTAMDSGENWDIVQLEASNQFSAAVSSEGTLYLWGNSNFADVDVKKDFQGRIAKVTLTISEYISLLKDGTVAYTGGKARSSPLAKIPTALEGKTVIDIASTSMSVAALTNEGEVFVWGNTTNGEGRIPAFATKPVSLHGGRFHYTVLLEDGSVVSWGNNKFGQTEVPEQLQGMKTLRIYTGNFQNYAITEDGGLHTWGLKGFLAGTDDLGRDMLTRIINGGRVTMTVGAVSVIIASLVGIILGSLAGYFGGTVDMVVMRITEIVGGLPFIPFAMILSAVIGTRIDPTNRMYLIMVVLGLLSWTGICRLVRAQFFAQREMEYVTAAKAMGIKEGGIVFRHILPNVFSILVVSMTLSFATSMLTESTLSYLGFGIPLPTPTWGNLLTGANNSIVIQQYWWRWVLPAAIFGTCTVCINLIGDGLRDALDPKALER
jgi:peptide/nickel transport system permease protein